MSGRLAAFAYSRARACCACSRCGTGGLYLFYCLACYDKQDIYWIVFFFGPLLIQTANKPTGYHSGSGTCRAKNRLVPGHIPFFRPGHLVPTFIMGFNSLMLFFMCQNLLCKSAIRQENNF